MQPDGFWTVFFKAANQSAGGVVVLKNGRVYGGDSSYYYLGTYQINDETQFTATVVCRPFIANAQTVFGVYIEEFTLNISGVIRGREIEASAAVQQMQGLVLKMRLIWRSEVQ